MLSIGLISFLVAIPVFSYRITPGLFNRMVSLVLIYSALLAINGVYFEPMSSGVGIYGGLFHATVISQSIEGFFLVLGAVILMGWAPVKKFDAFSRTNTTRVPMISEFSLMVLFTTMGSILLLSSSDLISMYLSIELQSFALYIMATLYRDSETATSAGLKYFLLGGLSSAFILLGTALIYSHTGLTQFESIYSLAQVSSDSGSNLGLTSGLLLIGLGFLFKVAAAPLHNWAPDVYDGVPTIVTTWLATMPKISIFIFILELQTGVQGNFESLSFMAADGSFNFWKNLLLGASLFSLVIGTVLGLSQYRVKRLLAYSTISHVGFLLLGVAINSQESVEAFLFYLVQYSITNLDVFFIMLAFGYILKNSISEKSVGVERGKNFEDVELLDELGGQFIKNPLLSFSFAVCLFSMAGIPPLVGFFGKQMVLYASTHGGYFFISLVAILVSVISAAYYLKIIRIMFFDKPNSTIEKISSNTSSVPITNFHAFVISTFTLFQALFFMSPSILLNSLHLLALSIFNF